MTFPTVYLVGAGPGDPGLITVRGLKLVQQAEVVIYDRLVHPEIVQEAPAEALRIYVGKETGVHYVPQEQINELLVTYAQQGRRVVRLKGGDPFVFGRGGEEAKALVDAGIPFEIVPGISSAIAVPAYAGIPVTHRKVATSFVVVTGHEEGGKDVASRDWAALATTVDTLVVLMGVKGLTKIVAQLLAHGRSPQTPVALIHWGTTSEQQTVTGTLADIIAKATAAGLEPPVVTVIGEVVALREHLQWFPEVVTTQHEALQEMRIRTPRPDEIGVAGGTVDDVDSRTGAARAHSQEVS
jgi:uroporphyrinogen III methyltransferase / synthase